jgi:Serine hydrolase (FSH1)
MTLKVLSLHGSQQNAEILRTRLGRIVPKVKLYASFTFIDAPHILPLNDGDEVRFDDEQFLVSFLALFARFFPMKLWMLMPFFSQLPHLVHQEQQRNCSTITGRIAECSPRLLDKER